MENFFMALGGGNEIGGSCYFLNIENQKIILDCGINFKKENVYPKITDLYKENCIDGLWELDCILLSHSHLDHTGALPMVISEAKNVPIFSTIQTKDILSYLFQDFNKNNKETNEYGLKIYEKILVEQALNRIIPKNYDASFSIKNFEITFFKAGHILGASMIYIKTEKLKILFTGDFSDFDQLTVPKYSIPNDLEVDILICESTYGYNAENSCEKIENEKKSFIENIKNVLLKDGKILIPAFAIGRSQEIAKLIYNSELSRIENINVYIDGMAKLISEYYHSNGIEIFNNIVKRANYSLIKNIPPRSIVISSSGMLVDGSQSAKYAEKILPIKENAIFFTGYLDEESPGKALSYLKENDGNKFLINRKNIDVNSKIISYRLSAHTGYTGIVELVEKVNPKKVILVHGFPEYENNANIAEELINKFNNKIKIMQSFNSMKIYI